MLKSGVAPLNIVAEQTEPLPDQPGVLNQHLIELLEPEANRCASFKRRRLLHCIATI